MKLEIITPDKKIYDGEVQIVNVPGTKGAFTILKNHAPIISTLEKGKVRIQDEKGEEKFFELSSGVVEVLNNNVIVLAEM